MLGGAGVLTFIYGLIYLLFLVAVFYTFYTIIVRIPRMMEENNKQLQIKLDRIAEALEKQEK